MAGGEAALIRERTARPPPRFLLPRASGHRVLPALPRLPPHDLVLDGGIQPRFEGWADSTDLWRQWVAKLRPRHEPQWRELGIREGVLASTCRVRREGEGALLQLVPFWCSLTDTFVFPWGEATVTLEDVAALAGLPILGFPVREPPQPPELGRLDMWADACALQALRALLLMDRSKGTGGGGGWADYFLRQHQPKEPGSRAERREHAAFLALWLARFVLPAPSSDPDSDIVSKEVIRIAARMVHGHRAALAPAALASIYGDLSELHRHLIYSKRTEAPSVWAPMHILQLWVWERFPDLRPATAMAKAGSIPDPAGVEEGDVLPRAALWDNVYKAVDPEHARAVFMAPTTLFQWRPYGTSFWVRHGLGPLSFARCLKACELVGMEFVEQYSPHRVARQLGFDQDVPGTVTRLKTNLWETAWETYNIGEEDPFVFAIPSDMPGVTEEYAQWWKPYTVAVVKGRDDDAMEIFDGLMNNNGDLMEDYSAETSKKGGSSGNNHGSSSGPKWAAGTLEMIQIASVNRQAGMAGSRDRVAKLLKEIQELAIDT